MAYLANGIQATLQKAFVDNGIQINVKSDHVVVENSQDQTKEKIRQIVISAGFFPLIFKNKLNKNFAFTIFPYKIPAFFKQLNANYFNTEEISNLLKNKVFIPKKEGSLISDKWNNSDVNKARSFVSAALTKALFDIISSNIKDEDVTVEIGSGNGYTFPESLSAKIVRTQPDLSECQLLRKSTSDPIYHVDIEGIYKSLSKEEKKVPLFFALNVFDTMSSNERITNLSRISQLQSLGDRLLIMLDANPSLDETNDQLQALYSNHAALPYRAESTKFSFILVPMTLIPLLQVSFGHKSWDLKNLLSVESQKILYDLRKDCHLKVVILEDFFAAQMKKELMQMGYTTHIYYHRAFKTVDSKTAPFYGDLIYKSVSDNPKEFFLEDKNSLESLKEKNIELPAEFDQACIRSLREKGQQIQSTEILVIEATKT